MTFWALSLPFHYYQLYTSIRALKDPGSRPVFAKGPEELFHLRGEGDHTLRGRLVFGFAFVCFLMSVVVVAGEECCFVGGDDSNVESLTWYRCLLEGV